MEIRWIAATGFSQLQSGLPTSAKTLAIVEGSPPTRLTARETPASALR